MLNGSADDTDLEAPALRVLERALTPGEEDPSRVSLVAALFVLRRAGDAPTGAAPRAGGIDLEGAGEELDALLGHLDADEGEGV